MRINTDCPTVARPQKGRVADLVRLLRQQAERATASNPFLGNEKALADKYGVSRGTFRSAVRELERQRVVRMVPGCRGGLYACNTSLPQAVRDLSDYLTLSDAPILGIAEFAMRLYRFAAIWAARRCAQEGSGPFKEVLALISMPPAQGRYIDTWGLMRRALVLASGNTALAFLHAAFHSAYEDALTAELRLGKLEAQRTRELWVAEHKLVHTAATGQAWKTYQAATACIDLETSYIRQTLADGMLTVTLRPETLYKSSVVGEKLAHQTLRALHAMIKQSQLEADTRLGSVMSLAQKFGVSPDVMRDTLWLGQRSGLIIMRRGRAGGVFVSMPQRASAIAAAATYLRATSRKESLSVLSALEACTDIHACLAKDILSKAANHKDS